MGQPARPSGASLVIAVSSLLVAFGAILIAIYSLDVARQAKSRAAAATSIAERANQPVAPTPGRPVPSPPGSAPLSPSAPASPRATYVAELVKQELRVPAPVGCIPAFVDVDTMQTGVYPGHEFYLSSCATALSLHIDQTALGAVSGADPSQSECEALLAGSTASEQVVLSVYPGLSLCLLTSKQTAINPGQPQRMAIIEVRSVNPDRSATVVVSTFRIVGA